MIANIYNHGYLFSVISVASLGFTDENVKRHLYLHFVHIAQNGNSLNHILLCLIPETELFLLDHGDSGLFNLLLIAEHNQILTDPQ
jgi:hypothetical protein